jgi:hypothetical protein
MKNTSRRQTTPAQNTIPAGKTFNKDPLEPGDLLEVPHWNDITSARWVGPREDWKFESVLVTVLDSGWGYDPRVTIAFPDGTARQLQTSIFRRMVETGKAKIVVKTREVS